MTFTVELGWPAKELSPNARAHFMTVSKAKKIAKNEAYWATKAALPPHYSHDGSRIPVLVTVYPSVRRDRDGDNFNARLKAAFDGIAAAMGVNDKLFDVAAPIFAEPVKHGRVVVSIGG